MKKSAMNGEASDGTMTESKITEITMESRITPATALPSTRQRCSIPRAPMIPTSKRSAPHSGQVSAVRPRTLYPH